MVAPRSAFNIDLTRPLTPLRVGVFEAELSRFDLLEKYPKLLEYLRDGFPIAPTMPKITETLVCPNYTKSRTEEALKIIREDFDKELELGRLIGPFNETTTRRLLGSHFRTSPVNVTPKKHKPGEYRIIRDLSASFKRQPSVNGLIPEDPPTRLVNFEEFAQIVSL